MRTDDDDGARDHRNYLCYMARLKAEHGSVMEYVRERRLGWTDLEAKGEVPFEEAGLSVFAFFFSFSCLFCVSFTCLLSLTG